MIAALVVVGGLAARAEPTVAQQSTRSVEWARFDVTLDVQPDGSFHVVERQAIDFFGGPFTQGFREIPLARTEGIENVVVGEDTAGGSQPYDQVRGTDPDAGTYTVSRSSEVVRIEWGFERTTNAQRVFVVEYDVPGALRVYPDGGDGEGGQEPYQEVQWFAVSSELTETAPVREASLTVRLPQAVPVERTAVRQDEQLEVDADPGVPADHTEDGRVWTWTAQGLTAGESLEARLQFPSIINVAPPAWQARFDEQQRAAQEQADRSATANLGFLALGSLLAIGGGLGVAGLWYARGRDPHTGLVAEFIPQPPDDLPAGAAGTLLDERADEQDVVATLVDLGHRRAITIEEQAADGAIPGFSSGGRDFKLTLAGADPGVRPFEADLLRALFGDELKGGSTVLLSQVKDRFDAVTPELRADLYAELVDRGYFPRSPEETRARWQRIGTLLLVLAVGGGIAIGLAMTSFAALVWVPILIAIVLAFMLRRMADHMPKKTAAGAEAAAKWRAFRRYLDDIEKYEDINEGQEIFDRYLPFAVAFGLDRSWVGKFASVQAPVPEWYGGMGGTLDPFGGLGGNVLVGPGGRRRRGFGGGTVIIGDPFSPLGGGFGDGGSRGGSFGGGGGGGGLDMPDFGLPDLQGSSDRGARGLQGTSDSLVDMLGAAGRTFGGFGGGGGGGFGGFGGGGGRGGGGGGGGGGFS